MTVVMANQRALGEILVFRNFPKNSFARCKRKIDWVHPCPSGDKRTPKVLQQVDDGMHSRGVCLWSAGFRMDIFVVIGRSLTMILFFFN